MHSISVDYAQEDYDAMIQAYLDTGEKEWISAEVTIDGVRYENVGLKLKGNSTLRSLSTDADAELSSEHPENLPWLIRLDKYVEGQNHEGTTELVVRGNSSETSLNEALALELLETAGLASEQAVAVRFSADGSEENLRLVIENPDDAWMESVLGDGLLYKAEAGGDYSYRGDDPASYLDVFEQEGGAEDLTPLIDFLQWLNESSDEQFAAELADHLDVDAFATYLAFQDLVDNSDDIDGPGNNSYLYYDPDTGLMTVVNWDLNLAYGASPGGGGGARGGGAGGDGGAGGGGGRGMPGGGRQGGAGARPDDAQSEDGGAAAGGAAAADSGAARPGGGRGGNILSERFLANADFKALYTAARERLETELYDSGVAAEVLSEWTQVLIDGASDIVSADVITQESEALAAKLDSPGS
ncbi:MAG: CotH kinase family protein [Leucobacter sp.]